MWLLLLWHLLLIKEDAIHRGDQKAMPAAGYAYAFSSCLKYLFYQRRSPLPQFRLR
ncbi:hypothetical protein LC607_29270 [Nostoc sp. CHAB 5824]|nr:hypothetical protein [Nostoc sp. CHAB 5824]